MNYTHLCTDLDGTLLGLKNRPTPFCCQVFKKYRHRIQMVLVSARMPSGMHYIQEALGIKNQPMVCYNGALVLKDNQVVSSTYIPIDLVKQIHIICGQNQIDMGLYAHDNWCAPTASKRIAKEEFNTQTQVYLEPTLSTIRRWEAQGQGAHKLMLMGTKETANAAMAQLNQLFKGVLEIYRSNDTLIEVSPGNVDKRTGIQALLEGQSTLENTMAFGDNFNDITMLTAVGLGVAVGNARPAVKEIAQTVVAPCASDGVAHFLEHFFNK